MTGSAFAATAEALLDAAGDSFFTAVAGLVLVLAAGLLLDPAAAEAPPAGDLAFALLAAGFLPEALLALFSAIAIKR